MKVLLTTFTYPPFADGCSEAAKVVAHGLARLGHSVVVATTFHPERKLESSLVNPRVMQFNISGTSNWRKPVRGEITKFQKFLCDFDGDLIIFETWDAWPTCLATPLFNQIKAKKVLRSHGFASQTWVPHARFPWGLGVWLGGLPLLIGLPWRMRGFDRLVFLSRQHDFGRFFDHRIARLTGFKKISVIPNGAFAREFNDDHLPDFRVEFNIGSGLMLLCVANYCDRKNQLLAVRAFRRARLKDATLVCIGSEVNEYAEMVKRLDEELRVEFPEGRVVLLEKLSRAQTCAAYQAADFFVLAAKAETQPIVLLEAMASRTPWISTDTGCVAELPGGLVVRSAAELTEKIKEMACSPELRKNLAGRLGCLPTDL